MTPTTVLVSADDLLPQANLVDVASLLHRHLIGAALTAACHSRLAEDTRCVSACGACRRAAGTWGSRAERGRIAWRVAHEAGLGGSGGGK